jgi:hypothetical protein
MASSSCETGCAMRLAIWRSTCLKVDAFILNLRTWGISPLALEVPPLSTVVISVARFIDRDCHRHLPIRGSAITVLLACAASGVVSKLRRVRCLVWAKAAEITRRLHDEGPNRDL